MHARPEESYHLYDNKTNRSVRVQHIFVSLMVIGILKDRAFDATFVWLGLNLDATVLKS